MTCATRSPARLALALARAPRARTHSHAHTPRSGVDSAGKTVGVAIVARKHIGLARAVVVEAMLAELNHRFAMKWAGAIRKRGFNLSPLYLVSGVEVKAQCNLDLLQLVAVFVGADQRKVGDWRRLQLHA